MAKSEGYPLGQKEQLLQALATPNLSVSLQGLLREEKSHIAAQRTSPDFLEILPMQNLVTCLSLIQASLDPMTEGSLISRVDHSPFDQARANRFRDFLHRLEDLVEQPGQRSDITAFVNAKRKYLGMPTDLQQLSELAEVFQAAQSKGLINDGELTIIHYGGSFNPFPHKGHLEVTRLAYQHKRRLDHSRRVVVSTTSVNSEKPELTDTFPERLDNLQRGFFNVDYATVMGIAGDFKDKQHRAKQLELIAEFDEEKRVRFVIGSDALLRRVKEALEGDEYSLFLLRGDHDIYISSRVGDDQEEVATAIDTAQKILGSEIIFLPPTVRNLSGTYIRSLPERARSGFAPNKFVNTDIPHAS